MPKAETLVSSVSSVYPKDGLTSVKYGFCWISHLWDCVLTCEDVVEDWIVLLICLLKDKYGFCRVSVCFEREEVIRLIEDIILYYQLFI